MCCGGDFYFAKAFSLIADFGHVYHKNLLPTSLAKQNQQIKAPSTRLLNYQQQHNQATDNNKPLYSSKLLSFISCSVEMNQQHATLNNNEHGGRLALRVSSCYIFLWPADMASLIMFFLSHSSHHHVHTTLSSVWYIGCLKPTCCWKCVQQGWWKTQQSQ